MQMTNTKLHVCRIIWPLLRKTKLPANYLAWLLAVQEGEYLDEQASLGTPILPHAGGWSALSTRGTCCSYNPQTARLKTREASTTHTGQLCSALVAMEASSARNVEPPRSRWEEKEEASLTPEFKLKSEPQKQPLQCNITILKDKHADNFKAVTPSKHGGSSKLVLAFPPHPRSERSQKAPGRHRILNCLILRNHLKGKFYLKWSKSPIGRMWLRINSRLLSPGHSSILQTNLPRRVIFSRNKIGVKSPKPDHSTGVIC